jgi:hypothetical protein
MSKVLPILFALLMQHKPATQKELPPPKPQQIVFGEGDWVSVTPVKPDGDVIESTRRAKAGNLHAARKHFIRELYKSAENVD